MGSKFARYRPFPLAMVMAVTVSMLACPANMVGVQCRPGREEAVGI